MAAANNSARPRLNARKPIKQIINAIEGKVTDMAKLEVYEPLVVKEQIIKAASEAATMILRVDDVLASGRPKTPSMPPMPPGGGGMGGMGGMGDMD